MGLENMRRWPMYIIFAVCILLILSLLNSWSMETDLRSKIAGISFQLQECSKQQESCVEESLALTEQRNRYIDKVGELDKQKLKMDGSIAEFKVKLSDTEAKLNRTLVDYNFCTTELQSLQNLKVSWTATLETLKLEKDALKERQLKITELEKEIEKLKAEAASKSSPNVPPSPKITPAAQPPKLSSALNPHIPINEPVLENNAKEELEDVNGIDGGIDVDPQLQ